MSSSGRRPAGQGRPAGLGKYPEPKWLGMIQHDMMLFDHGMPRADGTLPPEQRPEADVNVEFAGTSKMADDSQALAWLLRAPTTATRPTTRRRSATACRTPTRCRSRTSSRPSACARPSVCRRSGTAGIRPGTSPRRLHHLQRQGLHARAERRPDDAGRRGAALRGAKAEGANSRASAASDQFHHFGGFGWCDWCWRSRRRGEDVGGSGPGRRPGARCSG